MYRRVLVVGLALTVGLLLAANASAFNPATQSHFGACALETDRVPQAVHDYSANGVAADFARLLGMHGRNGALVRELRHRLVLGTVEQRVLTENHGCDGAGHWFAVGPRVLNRGEQVGLRLGRKLRRRVCVRSHLHCRRITVAAHVVFPVNCWNPNMGRVRVALYVRKVRHTEHVPKSKPKPRLKVESYLPQAPPPIPTPPVPSVLTAQPQAGAALSCATATVGVTIANAVSATAPAAFEVQGASYGPLAPGTSETIAFPLKPGERMTLSVASGTAVLIAGEQIVNECKAEPTATAKFLQCTESEGFGAQVAVTLANGSAATLPTAPFTVDWDAPSQSFGGEPVPMSETIGSLAPGESKTVFVVLEPFQARPTVTVTSGGKQILTQTFERLQCGG